MGLRGMNDHREYDFGAGGSDGDPGSRRAPDGNCDGENSSKDYEPQTPPAAGRLPLTWRLVKYECCLG
jgi:hypothetical protein